MAGGLQLQMKVTGLAPLLKKITITERELDNVLEAAVNQSAKLTLDQMQKNTPVDTGNLKDSEIITKPDKLTALVGPSSEKASYAYFVEVGHHTRSGSFVQGQFYVERTAIEMNNVVKTLFQNLIKTLIIK